MGWPDIPPEHDLIHTPPSGQPLWSESFFWFAYDPVPETGVVLHVTRMPADPGVWRAIVGVYLPDGELLVSKSYGRLGSDHGPGTGPLTITCEKPLHTWRIQFDGAAQRTRSAVLGAGPLVDGGAEPLRLDLTFDASAPIFDLAGDLADHDFAAAHQQQAGQMTGTVTTRDGSVELDGFSYRDHGWGPRDLSSALGDAWNTVRFPRAGLLCSIDFRSEKARIKTGYAEQDGTFTAVTPLRTPPLDTGEAEPTRFELVLRRGDEDITVQAEVVHYFTFTFVIPNDVVIGSDRARDDSLHACEAVVRYELDGETAYGLCERLNRVSALQR